MSSTKFDLQFNKLLSREITIGEVGLILEYTYQHNVKFNWHPLGFLHHQLFNSGASSLRLHIWPANERKYQEPKFTIHDHIFEMSSYVVVGMQTNVLYKVIENSKHPNGKLYSVEYSEGQSKVLSTGKLVYFEELYRTEYGSNKIYSMTDSMYHEADIPPDILTCTLVATKNTLLRTLLLLAQLMVQTSIVMPEMNATLILAG